MRPLSETRPKCLLPVAGRTPLDRVLVVGYGGIPPVDRTLTLLRRLVEALDAEDAADLADARAILDDPDAETAPWEDVTAELLGLDGPKVPLVPAGILPVVPRPGCCVRVWVPGRPGSWGVAERDEHGRTWLDGDTVHLRAERDDLVEPLPWLLPLVPGRRYHVLWPADGRVTVETWRERSVLHDALVATTAAVVLCPAEEPTDG